MGTHNSAADTQRILAAMILTAGGNDQFEHRIDESPTPNEMVVEDVVNNTELYRLPLNTTLATTLEQGGVNEISQGALQPQDPTSHATSHQDGGSDELSLSSMDVDGSTDGDVLKNNGGTLAWGGVPGSTEASDTDDGSDLTQHTLEASTTNPDTLLNLASGGVLVGGMVWVADTTSGSIVDVTVDGGTTYSLSGAYHDNAANAQSHEFLPLPNIRYGSSLKIDVTTGDRHSAIAYTVT